MNTPPKLTDRTQLLRNRNRAHRDAMFLHDEAIFEIKDRLKEVNRRFTKQAIVTGFPKIWEKSFPKAAIVGDSDTLDLPPNTFDLVISALNLHWANDPVGQLIQCQRALKPDGFFLGVMFGGQTISGLRSALAEAETKLTNGLSPRIVPMAEIRDLGGLLQRAGFNLPVADSSMRNVTYADTFALMRDLKAMGEGNALNARLRTPTRRGIFELASKIYAENHLQSDGRISAQFEFIFLSGWAPHESQQKPLRPGSATSNLADFLNK